MNKVIEECVPATDKDGLSFCYSIYQEDDCFHLEMEYNFSNNCEGEPTYYDEYFDTLEEVREYLANH